MTTPEKKAIRDEKVNELIKSHMMWCVGGGMIPIPVLDMFVVGTIQMNLIKKICKEYGIDYSEHDTKALVSTFTTQGLSKIGARTMAKLIPGIGSIIGGITLGVLSGASTYALGEVFRKHFEDGGTILDFDPSILKKYYDDMFEKGKKMAEEVRRHERQKHQTQSPSKPESVIDVESFMEAPEDVIETIKLSEEVESTQDIITKLTTIASLKEKGLLTEKEFKKLKKELLA